MLRLHFNGRRRVKLPPPPPPRILPRTPCAVRHLKCDERRRDALSYATPQELLDMDRPALEQRFKQAMDHVHLGGLQASDLQLPIYASPQCCKQPLEGYEGGAFDPQKLGVACIVVPSAEFRGANSTTADFNLHAVPTPSLLSSPPAP